MSLLRRSIHSPTSAVPPEELARQAAIEAKPWSRRAWLREQLRTHWPHLTLQQVELLKEVFQKLFDTEDKGYFTKDELYFVMEEMGRANELDAVMYELDSNGDGVVDFPEFLAKFMTATDENELLSVFHRLTFQEGQSDDDRVLTLAALERSFQYVGENLSDEDKSHLKYIYNKADKDGNGRLDIKEFTSYLEKLDEELFMGQAGALGGLLAATANGGGFRTSRYRAQSGRDGSVGTAADGELEFDAETAAAIANGSLAAIRVFSNRSPAAAAAAAALSNGVYDELESINSNHGRTSFFAKLRIGRPRRASVSSATIAALAEQLVQLGAMNSCCSAQGGSMGSGGGALTHTASRPEDALDGTVSIRNDRRALTPPSGHLPSGVADDSGVAGMRLVSSTGYLGGLLVQEGSPALRGAASTAPVSLSGGDSFVDGSTVDGGAVETQPALSVTSGASMAMAGTGGTTVGNIGLAASGSGHLHPRATSMPLPHSSMEGGGSGREASSNGFQSPNQQQPSASHQHPYHMHQHHHSRSQPLLLAHAQSLPTQLTPPEDAALLPAPLQSPIGGTVMPVTLDKPSVHHGFSRSSGMRTSTHTWRQASVIQEAPEEGDAAVGVSAVVPSVTRVHAPGDTRSSAPTRMSRLGSFPGRPTASSTEGGHVSSSRGTSGGGSGSGGGLSTFSRPMRTGSGGDGRASGPRFGTLMAAVFNRQRSLGPGMGATLPAPSHLRPRLHDPTATQTCGRSSAPSACSSQLPLSSVPSSPMGTQYASNNPSEGATGPPGASGPSRSASWSLTAGAWAAMGWLRRVSNGGSSSHPRFSAGGGSTAGSSNTPSRVVSAGGAASAVSSTSATSTTPPILEPPGPSAGGFRPPMAGTRAPHARSRPNLTVQVPSVGSDTSGSLVFSPISPVNLPSCTPNGPSSSVSPDAQGRTVTFAGSTAPGSATSVHTPPGSACRHTSQSPNLLPCFRSPSGSYQPRSASGSPFTSPQPLLQPPEPAATTIHLPNGSLVDSGSISPVAGMGSGSTRGPASGMCALDTGPGQRTSHTRHGTGLSNMSPNLKRCTSNGAGSRLAVASSPWDSPVPPSGFMQRQQSLQYQPPGTGSSFLPQTQQQQQPVHRLSHQGLPQTYPTPLHHSPSYQVHQSPRQQQEQQKPPEPPRTES